jgi:hypothetical protein
VLEDVVPLHVLNQRGVLVLHIEVLLRLVAPAFFLGASLKLNHLVRRVVSH